MYVDALSQLEIKLTIEQSSSSNFSASIEASGTFGSGLLAKLGFGGTVAGGDSSDERMQMVGHDIADLRYIADIIKVSERRLVVEDFHYMSVSERKAFAFDLKALWDFGVFAIIIGVWSQSNMLIHLNPDLSGRIEEVSIYWSHDDLDRVITKGGSALRIHFSGELKVRVIDECFGNVGILQKLILGTLDELKILQEQTDDIEIADMHALESAEMIYAEQLNPLYQQFARRVSSGIRSRTNSTGIYAHSMAVILDTPDEILMKGLALDAIYETAHGRQTRIQKGNLRAVLEKFEELQIDEDGRGLVLSYNKLLRRLRLLIDNYFSTAVMQP